MLSYKLYGILIDIIKETYPDAIFSENRFCKFYLDVISKEMKTIHGRYYPALKKIEIFNLSRPTGHIVATTIHEVAHHIDFCLRHNSDHTKDFYEVMYALLIKAIGMGIISEEDIATATDTADGERLEKYFGKLETWQVSAINYKIDMITIKVNKSFPIRDTLKSKGYKYMPQEQSWQKEIALAELDTEKKFLASMTNLSNVEVINANCISIDAIYYICIQFGDNHKEYLEKNGYYLGGFNVSKNTWNKKIVASKLDSEMSKIKHLKSIKTKVIGIK